MLPLTELGHSRQGQTKGRGSEMGKQPHVRKESARSTTFTHEMLPTYQEEPKLTNGRDGFMPSKNGQTNNTNG